MEEFVIARNPDESSSLPDLLRIPLASGAVVLKAKDTWPRANPASIATQLAEGAVRYPSVPIVFAETRQLAQEWTFRFFGAAVEHALDERVGDARAAELTPAGSVPHPATAQVRAWAAAQGLAVSDRGRISADVMRACLAGHGMSS